MADTLAIFQQLGNMDNDKDLLKSVASELHKVSDVIFKSLFAIWSGPEALFVGSLRNI